VAVFRNPTARNALVPAIAAAALVRLSACTSFSAADTGASGNDASPDVGTLADTGTLDAPAEEADPSLVARYSFEDPDGVIALDSSGHAHDGLLTGGTFVPDGVRGRALAMNGTDALLVDSLAGAAFPRTGTLSIWLRYAFTADPLTQAIFDTYDPQRSHLFVRRVHDVTTGDLQVALQAADGGYTFDTRALPKENAWTHLVVTWHEVEKTAACYVDGKQVLKSLYALPFVPTGQVFRMGERFVGALDEVRLYDRAMTSLEVARLD
jgi:hypothetical protein